MNTADVRAAGQLYDGMTHEALVIREVAKQIKELSEVLSAPDGWHNVVVDANTLVLVKPPWDVDWSAMVGADRIRLLIPLRVIEELDKYRYDEGEKRIKQVARRLLPQLEQRLKENNFTRVTVNERLTIQVPIVPGVRDRTLHGDEEVLQLCEDVQRFGNQALTLVTDDMPMRIQARARKLNTIGIDAKFRRSLDPETNEPVVTDSTDT